MSTPDPTPSLISYLAGNFADVGFYQNSVPEGADLPYMFMQVTGAETWGAIADDTPIFRWFVSGEVTALSADKAFTLGEQIKLYLGQKTPGAMGAGTVQGLRIADQSDDYDIRQAAADERAHIRALEIQVINYKESP